LFLSTSSLQIQRNEHKHAVCGVCACLLVLAAGQELSSGVAIMTLSFVSSIGGSSETL